MIPISPHFEVTGWWLKVVHTTSLVNEHGSAGAEISLKKVLGTVLSDRCTCPFYCVFCCFWATMRAR